MSSYSVIDVDTHVTETPDLWTSRAPARNTHTFCRSGKMPIRICRKLSPQSDSWHQIKPERGRIRSVLQMPETHLYAISQNDDL
jgi:hypothetical protein